VHSATLVGIRSSLALKHAGCKLAFRSQTHRQTLTFTILNVLLEQNVYKHFNVTAGHMDKK
jgi:hypothetical protein